MNHPHLTDLFNIYQFENQPFRKVHRMIDLFESLIKMHTVVMISEYVKYNKLSDTAKGMLAQGLRTPSLGTWQLFSRILFEELQQDGYSWTFTDFPVAFLALDKALNATKTNVVSFRNGYAHGATPTDQQCESDIKQFEPFLLQLLESPWLTKTNLEQKDNKVWIRLESNELCLHPILLFKEEADASPYAFFNDLKNDKVGLLNYPLSKHYREKQFYEEFHQYLPLHEWKKSGNNEFYQRIEELTETFKGRTAEREKLLKFVLESNKGYFSIQGNPGIGKSALIAQFFKDLKPHKEIQGLQVVEYFIRRGTAQAQVEYVINYLIRRTDELFPAGREIRAEGKAVWELQQQLFSKWRLWGEQNKGSKLLFLIDGLDEGVENNVVTYLPRENFDGVLVIYGSRPGGHKSIDELWAQLPVEHHTKLELSGLGKEDIRALIYEVANKYEIDRESAWIDAVQHRSQGNPLYLKLLCDAMENRSIALNDIHALPEKIDEYYKAILDRYAADTTDGDALLNALFTFAAAKDYITMSHLALINKLGDATVQRIGSTLKEVLYENPLTENVLDYQLFHESFREYLVKEKAKQVNEVAERIIDFCSDWKELEGTWEQRYALEHFAAHLSESKKEARIEILSKLIYDNSYTATQKKVLKGFDASNATYRVALKKSCELKREDDMLEAALCLVDLKYEEANDAPQVVAMVANGDVDFALKRIESFGGSDAEGMKRKFILYMLCLMELTLLDSKDKPFRKSAIEKLLNHLDENIPVDHSLLKWNDFIPSFLMFQMACEWAEMGLDYLRVYRKSDKWDSDWIVEKGPYSLLQFKVLLQCGYCLSPVWRNGILTSVSTEMAKQRKFEEACECIRGINSDYFKSLALANISAELAKDGKLEDATSLVQESLKIASGECDDWEWAMGIAPIAISNGLAKMGKFEESLEFARDISFDNIKYSALAAISTEMVNQGKLEKGASLLFESLTYTRGIDDNYDKSRALISISTELYKQGKLVEGLSVAQESLACARDISYDFFKPIALTNISIELFKQGNIDEWTFVVQESLKCAREISNKEEKSHALVAISTELVKKGNLDEGASVVKEALKCARGISNEEEKRIALTAISMEMVRQEKLEEVATLFLELLLRSRGISDEWKKSITLTAISTELAKRGMLQEALECARAVHCEDGVSYERQKTKALIAISREMEKQEKLDDVVSVMQESLESARSISDDYWKSIALTAISTELVKQGKFENGACVMQESLECARELSNGWEKNEALKAISTELARHGKLEESLECARGISNKSDKSNALIAISAQLAKQGKLLEWTSVVQESLECAHCINGDYNKSRALSAISIELSEQGKFDESLECARRISDDYIKSFILSSISTKLSKQGRLDDGSSVMHESLECAHTISDDYNKSKALSDISTELSKQGKFEEALECARIISMDYFKSSALIAISIELAPKGKLEESIECARAISDENEKGNALGAISKELAKEDNWQHAEKLGLEILQIANRYECWRGISNSIKDKDGWKISLDKINMLQNNEARLFFLKGCAENFNIRDIDSSCLQESLPFFIEDSDSIEKILQANSQHEIFFNKPSKGKINRLNKTLNIQWALDIIAKFAQEESIIRSSSNLSTWIDEIQDEDDRDQISLWAKQVTKGKISESEFVEKIKDFN